MQYTEAMQRFAMRHKLEGFCDETLKHLYDGEFDMEKVPAFMHFYQRIQKEVLTHPVIINNPYTTWFKQAELSLSDVRHMLIQFSVFSNQFLIAQMQKMINAQDIESMRASKEILANEIGVAFKKHATLDPTTQGFGDTEGSVEGGTFHFSSAHFELLVKLAEHIGLHFYELGRRCHATNSTIFFCDELIRLYGSADYTTSEAASFAVENWAAAGFWKELIQGLNHFKATHSIKMPLTFFTWHDKVEDNHAHHTLEELEMYYFTYDVDENTYIDSANEMLEGVYAFWRGLDTDRRLH